MKPPAVNRTGAAERFRCEVAPFIPEGVREAVLQYVDAGGGPPPEEVRLRCGRPLSVSTAEGETHIDAHGRRSPHGGVVVERKDIDRALELVTGSSLYAVEDQLRQGFVTLPGGHRVGLAGTAVTVDDRVKTFRNISGINYRVAMEARGAGDAVTGWLMRGDGTPASSLIISPPGCGKTTLLRDIVRCLADGVGCARAWRVCLVDERSEVAASSGGAPRNYVGRLTDVLDACPKAAGIMIGLRSLSPQVIATDEIGRPEDAVAIAEAVTAGVRVIATIHGAGVEDAVRRPGMDAVVRMGLFDRAILLSRRYGPGTIEAVIDLAAGGYRDDHQDRGAGDARIRMLRSGVGAGVDVLRPRGRPG